MVLTLQVVASTSQPIPTRPFSRLGTFTLTIDADAYKYEINVSNEDWLWDVLNFETGIIRDYRGINVSGSSSKLLEGSGIPVVPAFLVSNLDESVSNYITFNGTRYTDKLCNDTG